MGIFGKGKQGGSELASAIITGVDKELLVRAIALSVINLANVTLGATKDGKSVVIGHYDGKEQSKEYAADVIELNEVLETIITHYEENGLTETSPPPTKKPKQR